MARLTPHVLAALREHHRHTQGSLLGARSELQRAEERAQQARQTVAELAAVEAELRAALTEHIDATTAQVYRDAQEAERARLQRLADATPQTDPEA